MSVTAGAYLYMRPHNAIPSDLRDAVSDSAIGVLKAERDERDVKVPEPEIKPFYVETGSRWEHGNKRDVAEMYLSRGAPAKPVEYLTIPGGKFTMGTDSGEAYLGDAKPAHEVSIKTFKLAKTAVTVAQYAECVAKGRCTEPVSFAQDDLCNWGDPGRQFHPVNCVNWNQAQAYARFKGARLPSEAEWEYAARSGGRNQKYPWGNNDPATELAIFNTSGTKPVCSRPLGNTAQGLCDMSGNVAQWVQDKHQFSYKDAPSDGSAFEGEGPLRIVRGGSFYDSKAFRLLAGIRGRFDPADNHISIGFRIAR